MIFSGTVVKALLPGLQLGTSATIFSGAVNPSSVATVGAAGDLYLSTSTNSAYVKQDAGSSTNWSLIAAGLSFGAFGSTPNGNAASISGSTLTLQPADSTNPGGVSTTTQTFAGNKTFSGTIAASNLSGTNTGDVSLTAVGSSPSANGASLSGQALTLQPADATRPGLITAGTQTIGGAKTFASSISATNLSGTNTGDQTITLTGDVTGSGSGSFATTVAKVAGTTVSGTTGSTNVVFSTSPTLSNPVVGTQSQGNNSTTAASTAYVDLAVSNAIAGVNPAVAVQAATTQASDTSGLTYSNGVSGIGATFTGALNTALTVDGYTFTALGQRLLVKDDTQSPSGAFNGVYYVTTLQTVGVGLVLTRALDYDMPSDMNNTGAIPVINGTVNGTTSWVLTSLVVTVGTTPLTFTKFSRNPSDYLLKSAGDINETSFSAANNQSSAANVTGLSFANATVRAAKIFLSVYVNATSSLYEAFELLLIQKGASWEMAQSSVGDSSGFVFTVTSAGQVQYVNSNYSGFVSAAVRFRALTLSV